MVRERRSIPRFSSALKINAQAVGCEHNFTAYARDISMKGIRLFSYEDVEDDAVLDLEIFFPNLPSERVVAKSRWKSSVEKGIEVGCQFINISDYIKESIYNYILQYSPRELRKYWWKSDI